MPDKEGLKTCAKKKPDTHYALLAQWTCVKKTREQWGKKTSVFTRFVRISIIFILCIREYFVFICSSWQRKYFSTVRLESLRFSAVMTLCLYHNWLIKSKCSLDSIMKFSDFIHNGWSSYMNFSHSNIDAGLPVSLV